MEDSGKFRGPFLVLPIALPGLRLFFLENTGYERVGKTLLLSCRYAEALFSLFGY